MKQLSMCLQNIFYLYDKSVEDINLYLINIIHFEYIRYQTIKILD